MRNKVIIGVITGILLVGASIFFFNKGNEDSEFNSTTSSENVLDVNDKNNILNFIKLLEGAELENIKLTADPVGFTGRIFVPDSAIVNGISYFLEETNNDKMENIRIESKNENITVTVDYKVISNIKTPIEVSIKPTLNENNDLLIIIDEVKLLDIKIADWIVDIALEGFIEDWFSNTEEYDIEIDDRDIIIYKDNFKGVEITDIFLDGGLNVEVIIELDSIL